MAAWKIHLFGAFRLIDPESNQLDLKSKKLESLLAILLVSQPYGLSRDEICAIVWPGNEAKQNLRQALYAIRKILGTDAIEANLDHCRLSEGFLFECDYQSPELRKSDHFMPGCKGDWFDQIRTELESDEPVEQSDATDGFVNLLAWYAQNDVRGFYKVLRSSANLVRGIPFSTLKHLSDVAFRTSPDSPGWSLYWRGSAEENLVVSSKYLRKALKEAQSTGDGELASEVALELGKVYARLGKPELAMQVYSVAEAVATASGSKDYLVNSLRLKGTVLTYYGHADRGIQAMIKAENLVDDALGLALARGSRAYFLASVGRNEEALEALDWSLRITSGLGHKRISDLGEVTKGIIAANQGCYDVAIKTLEKVLEKSAATGFTQHGVCAADILAKIYASSNESGLANSKEMAAHQGRDLSKAVKTPLEIQRQSQAAK